MALRCWLLVFSRHRESWGWLEFTGSDVVSASDQMVRHLICRVNRQNWERPLKGLLGSGLRPKEDIQNNKKTTPKSGLNKLGKFVLQTNSIGRHHSRC